MEFEIKRGEMYWAQSDSLGVDQKLGRPIVVVSSNKGNEVAQHVIGLFCTSSERRGFLNIEVNTPRKKTWVQCNYPVTVFKERLGNYMYTLTEDEMAAVDRAMMIALSLDDSSSGGTEQIEELQSKIAEYEESKLTEKVSTDMWKRLYEKVMDELVSVRMSLDLSEGLERKSAQKKVVVKEQEIEESEISESEAESPVEINSCSEADLREIGCTPAMIHHIITNRPYRSVEDLKTVPSVTRVGYKLLEPRVCCIPAIKAAPKSKPKPKNIGGKLNLNTASVEDLRRIGFGKITAEFIVKYRTKNGPFSDVEDLRKISRVGNGSMARIGQKLEV